LDLKYKNK